MLRVLVVDDSQAVAGPGNEAVDIEAGEGGAEGGLVGGKALALNAGREEIGVSHGGGESGDKIAARYSKGRGGRGGGGEIIEEDIEGDVLEVFVGEDGEEGFGESRVTEGGSAVEECLDN